MSHIVPTPGELIATLPAFAGVETARVQYWIDRAARVVDETWAAEDYELALMLHAAHEMVLNGFGAGADAEAAAAGASAFRSLRSGSLALERFDGGEAGGFAATQYDRQLLPLLRRNRGGPRVARA